MSLPEHVSSPPVFSGVHVTRSAVLCVCCLSFCTFYFGHCVVSTSSIYRFSLPLWYLQTPFTTFSGLSIFNCLCCILWCLFRYLLWPGFPTLSPLFCSVQWVKIRGDYSFYRYWWSCWPSLFKLSFLNCHRNKEKDKITLSPWKIAEELWGHNYIYHKLT